MLVLKFVNAKAATMMENRLSCHYPKLTDIHYSFSIKSISIFGLTILETSELTQQFIKYKMSENDHNQNQKIQPVLGQVNQNNSTSSIQPTHAQKKDPGIIQSHTNFTENPSQQLKDGDTQVQGSKIQSVGNQSNVTDNKTASIDLDQETKQIIQDIFKPEPIKKEEVSIQVGGGKNVQVLKNTQETYAPESCQIHIKQSEQSQIKASGNEDVMGGIGDNNNKISQVEIQVGVSLLDEPEKAINAAKQQRILSDHDKYVKFLQNQKLMSQNQKSVYNHVNESVEAKKSQILGWHDLFKDHFSKYASIMKDFAEKCEKTPKQQKGQQANKFLNIGQQLKDGYSELVKFRQNSGQNHRNMSEYTQGKTIKDLERAYSNYTHEMASALSSVNDKKKASLKIQEQLKKQGSKVQKMFTRTKEGKKQEDDFFIELSKAIVLEQNYRASLTEWGKQISILRKSLINFTQGYCNQIQQIFNAFKNESNSLYGIQKTKYDKIRNSRQQIAEEAAFSKLIILVDSDYIRCSLESALKKQVTEITDKQFDEFVEIPQAKLLLGEPRQLLMNMVVKKFNLKDPLQQLIHTISGNLVLYNKKTLQCSEKMSVKNIKTALTVEEGAIEIEEKVYGVIFASKKKIKIEFQDSDRAEQLVCFLGQGETSNN